MSLILERARLYGQQKRLAADAGLSEVELSRLLHEQREKFENLLDLLGLEVVDKDHVQSLRKVLKEVL